MAQRTVATAVSAETGARVLARLAMPASPDTLLRLVRRAPLPTPTEPRVVGIDDWAMHEGTRYGSIVVDLEARRVVHLLPDRTAPTVSAWLARHPGVTTVARDRSPEYARATALGAPQAQQVADRWHLLHNSQQMAERWLTDIHPRLRALPPTETAPEGDDRGAARDRPFDRAGRGRRERGEPLAPPRGAHRGAPPASGGRVAAQDQPRGRAGPRHGAQVRVRGVVPRACGARAGTEPARPVPAAPRGATPGGLHERPRALARDPCDGLRGHAPSGAALAEPAPPRAGALDGACAARERLDATGRPPRYAAVAAAARVGVRVRRGPRTCSERTSMARIVQYAEARGVALVERFVAIMRGRCETHGARPVARCGAIDRWFDDAKGSGISSLQTFAAGLVQDGDALLAALTTTWSNAQAEGQITRLKIVKRQMYGRANFDLLRRRILLAA